MHDKVNSANNGDFNGKNPKKPRISGYVDPEFLVQFKKMVNQAARTDGENLKTGSVLMRVFRIVRSVDRASLERLAALIQGAEPPQKAQRRAHWG